MNINSDERRIGLSIKRLEMEDDKAILTEYVSNMKPAKSVFGEILQDQLKSEHEKRSTEGSDDKKE